MRACDGYSQSNFSASSDDVAFDLVGGEYAVNVSATWSGGTVTLQFLQLDGSTWTAVSANTTFTDDGFFTPIKLPAGKYRFHVATATAVYAGISRVPGE